MSLRIDLNHTNSPSSLSLAHFSLENLHLHQITNRFPPHSLKKEDRIALGVKVLEKYGEADFAYFQREYRLTLEEHQCIFQQAEPCAKDLVTWEALDQRSCQEEVDIVKSVHPDALFSLLCTREENHRTHPMVQIDGKHYYFYSQAFKGPIVDDEYIVNYGSSHDVESRPNFRVLTSSASKKKVFLMECPTTQTPNFRDEHHLTLLVDLIFSFSCNKKGLDMLPCRLAYTQEKIYSTDQKPHYGLHPTTIAAFHENIKMLKAKISYRGFAEEDLLLSFVDTLAKRYLRRLFDKTLQDLRHIHKIDELLPPSSLNSDEKIILCAAILCMPRFGSSSLFYVAREYSLSRSDQAASKKLAGNGLVENRAIWEKEITEQHWELQAIAAHALQQNNIVGAFSVYTNRVGNYKSVLTVTIGQDTFVIRKVDKKYIDDYQCRMQREHRPSYLTFPLEENAFLFLAKFMGSKTLDYNNKHHLDMVIELALSFSGEDGATIDLNEGNLVVQRKQLFYIDKDLVYWPSDNPRLANVQFILVHIDQNLHTPSEQSRAKNYVRHAIERSLDPSHPEDLTILEAAFPEQYRIIREKALQNAVMDGDANLVGQLLRSGPISEEARGFAVFTSANNGHIAIAQALLENGPISDLLRELSLREASQKGYVEIVRSLLASGSISHTTWKSIVEYTHLAGQNNSLRMLAILTQAEVF